MKNDKVILAPKKRLTEAEKIALSKDSVFYKYESKKNQKKKRTVEVHEFKGKKAVFFDRLSEENDGSMHFESCLQLAIEYTKKHDLVFDKRSYLEGGSYFLELVTGSSETVYREASEALVKYLKVNDIDVVIVYSLERLGRNAEHINTYVKIFAKHNIKLIFLDAKFQDIDFKTPLGRFFFDIFAFLAEIEAHNISGRVIRSMQHNALLGFETGGNAPFGMIRKEVQTSMREKPFYVCAPDTEIIPDLNMSRADIVIKAAKMWVDGIGTNQVAKWMNSLNIPTYTTNLLIKKKNKLKVNAEIAKLFWSETTVRNLITNPKLAGYRTIGSNSKFNKDNNKSAEIFIDANGKELRPYEPVYTDELWEQIKLRKSANVAYNKSKNMARLRSLLFCSRCDGRMVKRGNKSKSVYTCPRALTGACVSNNIKAEVIDNYADQLLITLATDTNLRKEFLNDVKAKDNSVKVQEQTEYNTAMLNKLKSQLQKTQELYVNDLYVGGIKEYKREIERLNLEISKYSNPVIVEEIDVDPFSALNNLSSDDIIKLTNEQFNEILHCFINKIIIIPNSDIENPINSRLLANTTHRFDIRRVKVEYK